MRTAVMTNHHHYRSRGTAAHYEENSSKSTILKWIAGILLVLIAVVGYIGMVNQLGFKPDAWISSYGQPASALIMDHKYGSREFMDQQTAIGLKDCKIYKEDRVYFFNMNQYSGGYGMSYSPTPDKPVWAFSERVTVWNHVKDNWYYWESKASLNKTTSTLQEEAAAAEAQ